ncbi:putative cysteine desulfurase [Stieleria maiorica]|uniref:Putative cysteine desulfurase n=1 Tax=Stieleria maiorica TaxID=2795974 RepID=A0A5B9MCM0_9BACT|nr:aminotransferase class V-fold PLP-dependent enzyme [Stieleria maiorica]QEF97235.1 putative cysteine desulfurase [Stieleria maiorica]
MTRRIYLDHAATCYPKSPLILDAMHEFSTQHEAAVGRGAYRASQQAGQIIARLRREIAAWIGAADDQEVSLHSGGTAALNAGLLGILTSGDHVVTTAAEHNSVLRPLQHLVANGSITWTVVPVDAQGQVSVDDVLSAVTPQTRMVAVVHAANVNGAVQPVEAIGRRLVDQFDPPAKPLLFIDAAQTFGHLPLSVTQAHIDVLAAPGHKGGSGPLGTGFLYVRREAQDRIRPTVFGGTGTRSESLEMPNDYPASFEAGNLNVPAYAGWLAGLRSRRAGTSPQKALETSRDLLAELASELYRGLEQVPGVRVIGRPRVPVLPVASIAIDGFAAGDAAMILDSEFGIEVRSGLHCAALIHPAIKSPDDGTVRISCGETTTREELELLFDALDQLCR